MKNGASSTAVKNGEDGVLEIEDDDEDQIEMV